MGADGRKAIFITGAASGIGLAAARRFAREGWFVGKAGRQLRFAARFMPGAVRKQLRSMLTRT
jgi:NAD(P)-dependent dehydrogenase (short-subunit alcohol dehydrogenase family)